MTDTDVVAEETTWPMLTSASCTMTVLSLDDAPAWLAGEDADIVRWFEFPRPSRAEDVQEAITSWRENWQADGPVRQWGIWHDGHLAGGVEIQDRGDRRANISYVVFSQYRRRGLALDAVGLATMWALDHLPIDGVVAVVDVENVPSRAVVERFGFVSEGLAERWEYDESGPSLRYVYPPM